MTRTKQTVLPLIEMRSPQQTQQQLHLDSLAQTSTPQWCRLGQLNSRHSRMAAVAVIHPAIHLVTAEAAVVGVVTAPTIHLTTVVAVMAVLVPQEPIMLSSLIQIYGMNMLNSSQPMALTPTIII